MSVSVLVTSELELSPSLESEWLNDLPPARRAQIGRWPERRDRQRSLLASRCCSRSCAASAIRPRPSPRCATRRARGRPSTCRCTGASPLRRPHRRRGLDRRPGRRRRRSARCLQAGDFALYLNAAERAWAGRSPRRFYSVWTRKEAVAKAAGTNGLPSLPAVDTAPAAPRGLRRAALANAPLALGAGHVGHVASADLDASRDA
jgi:4'-phosphopantetheinyl transferase